MWNDYKNNKSDSEIKKIENEKNFSMHVMKYARILYVHIEMQL